jgi:poly-gamma-glutamate capsule biosynthesis protein CapA/YwtB (metallophosphatase superfamily)
MASFSDMPLARQRQIVRAFLCGDVMLGRGIDQVLSQPCDPTLHEDYCRSAMDYVQLAEKANGAIMRPLPPFYIWGVAREELALARPDVRIINLETSITRSEDYDPKGINYRMSHENAVCLRSACIDCCVLANNHVLEWRRAGLFETLATLRGLQIKTAGAGRGIDEAAAAAVLPISGKGRVLVYSFASPTSGTPRSWAATPEVAGVNLLTDLSDTTAYHVIDRIVHDRQRGDLVIVSIHWGPNWGYSIPEDHRDFARALIDDAGVSIVHGHSSHHPKGNEVYKDRLILYGCGDFLNDYEGIGEYERYRGSLTIMYFVDIEVPSRVLA